jgi:uncharacterized membrane protein
MRHIRATWNRLHSSYWFLPALLASAAVGLSFASIALDENLHDVFLQKQGWIYSGSPEGARAVLSAIATSIITVAGTTFSITIAVLSLASGQFGPRLIRNFMRDTASQLALGIFTATFLYCLLVLRTVRGTDRATYVPHLSVTCGVLLATVCVGVLIFFIHHTAESIQVSHLIDLVGQELDDAICRLFPGTLGENADAAELPGERPQRLLAKSGGYLQEINEERLLEAATHGDSVIRLHVRPGDYIIPGMQLASVWMSCEFYKEKTLQRAFTLGRQRTPDQDAEFAFLQLVELAVRALSPGINDPFTAIMCIDRLSAALCLLADRSLPSANRLDRSGRLRIVACPYSYERLVRSALSQIRENGKSHTAVVDRLRYQIDAVLARARQPEFRQALRQERDLLSN